MSEANGQWNYGVDYDPNQVTLDSMLKAISDLGYQPSRHGSITVSANAGGISVSVAQKGKLERSKQGKLEFKLKSKAKGDVAITASNDELGVKATHEAKLNNSQTVNLDVEVPEGAKTGDHELTVVIRVGDEELRLKLPVQIE
ncbi:MAG: hypothetical protein KDD82_00175 [Planctomycetes bacterium]|nr:hypothetical protein [Planctomycetota bacterium]